MSRENTLRWPTILMVPSDQELMRECRGKTLLMLRDKFNIDEIAFFHLHDSFNGLKIITKTQIFYKLHNFKINY